MKFEELKQGLPVRIVESHKGGYGGRRGIVLDVGTFPLISGGSRRGALVDIGETGLLVIEATYLEIAEIDPPDPGWEEYDI